MEFVSVVLALLALYIAARLLKRRRRDERGYEHVVTMVVLGSGGHTSEMLKLMAAMDLEFYSPRVYVVADTDSHSADKAKAFEQREDDNGTHRRTWKWRWGSVLGGSEKSEIVIIPRSREVGQSFATSVFTTARGLLSAVGIVWRYRPELVLVNGPGTCIPICCVVQFFSFLPMGSCKLVFLESIARVDSLSLSGKILYYGHLTDVFLVQWPELVQKYPRARYAGRLY